MNPVPSAGIVRSELRSSHHGVLAMTIWRYLDSGPDLGAHNMAVDEDLLARAKAGEKMPVLRLYTWAPPAVSLGRFQDGGTTGIADACRKRGIDVVRRVTGGRAVLHNHELTYSVVSPAENPLFPDDVLGTYKVIARGLLAGLRNLGIQAEMVSRSGWHADLVKKESKAPSCFSSPSWYEIVVKGKKIIGSAQRRERGAFLQHGSLLIDHDAALEAAVIPGGSGGHKVSTVNAELGRRAGLEEVKTAFLQGFSEALGVVFFQDPSFAQPA